MRSAAIAVLQYKGLWLEELKLASHFFFDVIAADFFVKWSWLKSWSYKKKLNLIFNYSPCVQQEMTTR